MTDSPPAPALAEVFEVALPLVRPFTAAHGTMSERRAVLVRLEDRDGAEGWGECGADITPYSAPESPDTAWDELTGRLLPAWLASSPGDDRGGGPMARAAFAAAQADLAAQRAGRPLAVHWGGTVRPVPVGAVVGFASSRAGFENEAEDYIEQGYRRLKIKIRPGWDAEPVGWLRDRWPDFPLAVDANGSYGPDDTARIRTLDGLGLDFIEQPFAAPDVDRHARLAESTKTPICLDESITSVSDARRAIELGAARLVAIKTARLGGWAEAIAVHDLCVEAGVRPWVGGLLETGIGRAHAVALATLPGFVDAADLSGSDRYFADDLVDPPWRMEDGNLLPTSDPGIGRAVREDVLLRTMIRKETLRSL